MPDVLKDRPDMLVERHGDEVVKTAKTPSGQAEIVREADALLGLADNGIAPTLLSWDDHQLREAYVEAAPVTDTEELRRNVVRLLLTLRAAHTVHGDATSANIIVTEGNRPVLTDWGQSGDMLRAVKRPETDAWHLFGWLANAGHDSSRKARRWLAIMQDRHWQRSFNPRRIRIVDYGCDEGDFCAMAAATGEHAVTGIDRNPGAIEIARSRWQQIEFRCTPDLLRTPALPANGALVFSVWPYLVQQAGEATALAWLGRIIGKTGATYFETQLVGDGPGYHADDAAVLAMLGTVARSVTPVITIPVAGREPLARTVWRLT